MELFLGVVHNDNPERMTSLRETVETVSSQLEEVGYFVKYGEASYQPAVHGRQRIEDIWRRVVYDFVVSQGAKVQAKNTKLARLFFRTLMGFALWVKRSRRDNRLAIQIAITAKHLHLIETALNGGAKQAIFLEDDAVLHNDSSEILRKRVLPLLQQLTTRTKWFVNLAGDSLETLIPSLAPLSKNISEGVLEVFPAQVDTVCAYALDRDAMDALMKSISLSPNLRNANMDHLLNRELPRMGARAYHLIPGALGHGSNVAMFSTWR
jgi:hypothetical protein